MKFHSKYKKSLSDVFWHALGGAGKDRTAQDIDNSLHYAALTGKLWRADFLLREKKAKVASGDNFALRWAANGGHVDMLRLLLEHGADVNAKDGEALVRVVEKEMNDAAFFLLDHGANPSLHGGKAFYLADEKGNIPLLKKMLEGGKISEGHIRCVQERAKENGDAARTAFYGRFLRDMPPPADAKPPRP